MYVKIAVPEDVPKLMPLLCEMHASGGLNFPPIDGEKVAEAMFGVVKGGLLLLAMNKEDKPVGILALMQQEFWFSKFNYVADMVFYVDAKHRSSSAALKLIKAAREIAGKMGVPLLMSVLNGVDVERKENFYTKMGFKKVGGTYGSGI